MRNAIQFVLRRDCGNTTQTSTRHVSEEACRQRTPRWGLKRADGLTRVSTVVDIADSTGSGLAHSPQNNHMIEERL